MRNLKVFCAKSRVRGKPCKHIQVKKPSMFDTSKIVDNAGDLLVVHHGTNKAFEAFTPGRLHYFTDDYDAASARGSRVVSAVLNIRSPLDISRHRDAKAVEALIVALDEIGASDAADEIRSDLDSAIKSDDPDPQNPFYYVRRVALHLRPKYDGLIYEDWGMD